MKFQDKVNNQILKNNNSNNNDFMQQHIHRRDNRITTKDSCGKRGCDVRHLTLPHFGRIRIISARVLPKKYDTKKVLCLS